MSVLPLLLPLLMSLAAGAGSGRTEIYDSGGPLMPEQAAYDVRFYDLTLSVHPSDSSINGSVIIRADVVQPIDMFVVDLDTLLTISGVAEIGGKRERERSFRRDVGKIWITLQRTRQAGESITLLIRYGGRPRIAPRPPRNGGFT
ncbi:MAG: M1 family peptidase, partial [Bacteroidota bacterium]